MLSSSTVSSTTVLQLSCSGPFSRLSLLLVSAAEVICFCPSCLILDCLIPSFLASFFPSMFSSFPSSFHAFLPSSLLKHGWDYFETYESSATELLSTAPGCGLREAIQIRPPRLLYVTQQCFRLHFGRIPIGGALKSALRPAFGRPEGRF